MAQATHPQRSITGTIFDKKFRIHEVDLDFALAIEIRERALEQAGILLKHQWNDEIGRAHVGRAPMAFVLTTVLLMRHSIGVALLALPLPEHTCPVPICPCGVYSATLFGGQDVHRHDPLQETGGLNSTPEGLRPSASLDRSRGESA